MTRTSPGIASALSPSPTRVPRSPVVQAAVLVGLALLVGALVFNGSTTSSAEAYVVSSAAHAAHIRHLAHDRRSRGTGKLQPPTTNFTRSNLDRIWGKLSPQRAVAKTPLRWLAIGDSITQGLTPETTRRRPTRRTHPANGSCGYLSAFRTLSNRHAHSVGQREVRNIEFVGQSSEAHLGPYPQRCGEALHHCATWGITAAAVVSNDGYRPTFRPLHLAVDGSRRESLHRGARVYDWVRQQRPDVVSILLGTNDLAAGTSHAALVDEFLRPAVLQTLRAAEDGAALDRRSHADSRRWESRGKCDAVVVVMLLLPRSDGVNDEVVSFNEKLERRDRNWLHDRCVEVISVSDGLDPHNPLHFYDGVHPAVLGEDLIAHNMLQELTTWINSSNATAASNATR